MFSTLLTQITGVIQKEFWFALFVPTLLFAIAVTVAILGIIGIDPAVAWLATSTLSAQMGTGTAAIVAVIIGAYVAGGLRPSLQRLWSGMPQGWLLGRALEILRLHEVKRYEDLRRRAADSSPWLEMFDRFRHEATAQWNEHRTKPTTADLETILRRVTRVASPAPEGGVRHELKALSGEYGKWAGALLAPLYEAVRRELLDRHQQEILDIQSCAAALDRSFGPRHTVRPTRLGNVIEAYNHYAFTRYGIEGAVFWPRLRHVIPAVYLGIVDDQRVQFDFCLVSASYAILYAAIAAVLGPWLVFPPTLWIAVVAVALLVAAFFYRSAVIAADAYGDVVRSSYDMFRLDLLRQLKRPAPGDLGEERERWREVSRLAIYGIEAESAFLLTSTS